MIIDFYFTECPLCNSKQVKKTFVSIQKDMSEEGYTYNQCSNCLTYYAGNGTISKLNDFYNKLPPYQSASSKTDIVQTIAKDLKIDKKSKMLDIGCGSGAWALPFLPFCDNIICVDTDANAVEILRQTVPAVYKNKVSCIAMDCDQYLDTTLDDNFDIILSMFSFEHQLYPVKFLKQLYKVLAPNGFAIVLIPSGDALQLKLLGSAFYWAQAPWHTMLPTQKGFEIAATTAGFNRIKVYNPGNNYYSWFWLRGLSDKVGMRKQYDYLRQYAKFRKFDIFLDKILDRISFLIKKPSYRFYIIQR
jgi:SAM-dependent methyltransferase